MATTGKRLARALIFVALASALGCSPAHDDEPPTGPIPPTDQSSVSAPPSGTPADQAASFCSVDLPASWKSAADAGRIEVAHGETLVPVEVSTDGTSVFADVQLNGKRTLAWIRDHGRKRQQVHQLPDADTTQVFGTEFDGRWLVFGINYDFTNTNNWKVFAWDSQSSAAPFEIASNAGVEGPFLYPRVYAGKAAWVAGVPDGSEEIHLYDLAARKDRVVHRGHTGPAFFGGGLLIWREAFAPDAPVQFQAVTADSGEKAQLPPVIAAVRGASDVITDGATWAWVSPDRRGLHAWRPGMSVPITVTTVAVGEWVDALQVAGDLITWTGGTATWAADLRSHSLTQVTPRHGWAIGNGQALAISYPTEDPKAARTQHVAYVVTTAQLNPLPTCTTQQPIPQPSGPDPDPSS